MKLSVIEKDFNLNDVENSIKEILENNKLFSLATIDKDNNPWINNAFYSFDNDLNLYFVSSPSAIHINNVILNNNKVAVSIANSNQTLEEDKQGLQITGECFEVENARETLLVMKNFGKRYFSFGGIVKVVKEMVKERKELRAYKIIPSNIKILDEARFGEETWVDVKIEQK